MHTHVRHIILIALAALLLPLLSAPSAEAAEKKSTPSVVIRMTDEGRIYVGDTYTGLKGLVPHLKRKRYPTSTRITIEIPQQASEDAIRQIGQTLASGKYFSMRFRKPLVAEARTAPLPGAPLPPE